MAEPTGEEIVTAVARGKARLRGPRAESAHYDAGCNRVVVRLTTGVEIGFSPRDAEGLERASAEDLKAIEVEAFGLGIHFPRLDADIYVPALVKGVLGSKRWIAEKSHDKRGPTPNDRDTARTALTGPSSRSAARDYRRATKEIADRASWAAVQMTQAREFVIRFAIGDRRGARSSVWRIWKSRNKDDIYVAPRLIAGIAKGSLHESGLCFFSFTSQHHQGRVAAGTAREKRTFTRWQRRPTPDAGMVGVVSLLFPDEFLSPNPTPVDPDTALIQPPKTGQAVVVDLLFAQGGGLHLSPNQQCLGHVLLSTGEEFFAVAGLVNDFDALAFRRYHQPLAEHMQIGFLERPQGVALDDLRGAILLPAVNDGVLRIVEVSPNYIS
jgi:hypothetical protein